MDPFITGLITLFIMTAVFYIVIFSFIYYWHLKETSYVVLPLVFTFDFFIRAFAIVAIVSIFINNLSAIAAFLGL